MPRYFFHTEDRRSLLDRVGVEFDTLAEAKIEAVQMMGEMLKDTARQFWDASAMKVIVTDEGGLILFVLGLSAFEAPAMSVRRQT